MTTTRSDTDAMVAAACLFHGMGDSSRVRIVRHLLLGEHNVRELTAHLGLAQSTVSGHLACLRECGLITSRPVGRASVFRVAEPELVCRLLAAAEALLAAQGAQPRKSRSCSTSAAGASTLRA